MQIIVVKLTLYARNKFFTVLFHGKTRLKLKNAPPPLSPPKKKKSSHTCCKHSRFLSYNDLPVIIAVLQQCAYDVCFLHFVSLTTKPIKQMAQTHETYGGGST